MDPARRCVCAVVGAFWVEGHLQEDQILRGRDLDGVAVKHLRHSPLEDRLLQRHDRNEKLHARRPARQRHELVSTHLLEQRHDRHGLRTRALLDLKAPGIQGICQPLIGDGRNRDQAVGVLRRAGHAPEARRDGSADRVRNGEFLAHVCHTQNDVRQGGQVMLFHRPEFIPLEARRNAAGSSTTESAAGR